MINDTPPHHFTNYNASSISSSRTTNTATTHPAIPQDLLTSAETTPPPSPPRRLSIDDIFGSQSDGEEPTELLSNLPLIRRTHTSRGYRDGVAVSKGTCLQEGFDEGWALGAEVGVRAGWVLGILEGWARAFARKKGTLIGNRKGNEVGETSTSEPEMKIGERDQTIGAEAMRLLAQARDELSLEKLLSERWVSEEGLWKWDVANQEEDIYMKGEEKGDQGLLDVKDQEREMTFKHVAASHPVLRSWGTRLTSVGENLGAHLEFPEYYGDAEAT